MANSDAAVAEENARLKKELQELQQKREQEAQMYEQRVEKEKATGRAHVEQVDSKTAELTALRSKMAKLTKQLDEEVTRRDIAQNEAAAYAARVQDYSEGAPVSSSPSRSKGISFEKEKASNQEEQSKGHASTKLMRVIEHWMTHKDLQQALLRGAGINDMSFSTVVQVLSDCPSLQTLDLTSNHLTMDSCSEVCTLITAAPQLSFVSLADNLFSLRSLGYFMTAVMERQNTKKLTPLDLLDLHGNEGLVAAAAAPPPDAQLRIFTNALGSTKLPPRGAELITQVSRALWRFLHDTGHPQVRNLDVDDIAFQNVDRSTVRKMETALLKILILEDDSAGHDTTGSGTRAVTADLIFLPLMDVFAESAAAPEAADKEGYVSLPPINDRSAPAASRASTAPVDRRTIQHDASRSELRDPFADLKAAFEPPKEKLKTFNLKQIVTRNGNVLMNMLERLLETTEIDAHDVETEQTLLEYACQNGNVGLAKLCYRRGANLSARTRKGDTAFNIVTRSKRYDIMEFLHKYGVKVNSCDAKGQTALHIACSDNDVDAVCRLLEWGADVNLRDNEKKTPLHTACAGGHYNATMLLLEVGAELNAQDEKGFTPAASAEKNNHFALMDRLVMLGGKGHGLSQKSQQPSTSKSLKTLGGLSVSPQMLKSSSLGRIGKIKVKDLPEPLRASLATTGGKHH